MNDPGQSISYHPLSFLKPDARFSIIIPSWNNLELLKLCIESLQKNSSYPHQLIVHVNEGSDGSLEWIKTQEMDYTHSKKNAGVCYALNASALLAKTDYIVYMNDDMYACPGWDRFLWEEIEKTGHEFFFFSATMIEPAGHNPAAIAAYDYGRSANDFKEEELLKHFASFEKPDWSGAGWPPNVVHKKMWAAVGGYSIEFSPGFYSDPDFCMKLWKAGVRIFKGIGKSRVYHFQSRSTARVTANKGRQLFATKWKMPASYFYKNVLRMGQDYHGPLGEIKMNGMARLKTYWQRVKG